MTLRRIISGLVLFLASWTLSAQEKAVDIFVLTTHAESSEWVKSILSPVEQLQKERPELTVEEAYLHLTSHPDVPSLLQNRDSVLAARTLPPRLVILLGGSCYNFAPDVQNRWPGVPILLLGEQDYYCDIDYALDGPADPEARRYPVTDYLDRGLNLTLVSAPALIRLTAEMIMEVQPSLERMFFIGGENYMSRECQWRMEQYMSTTHPEIDFQVITTARTSTDELIALLEKQDDAKTAAVYSSWLARKDYLETISTRHNTLSLIEHIVPTYSLLINDCRRHPYLMGFCSYSYDEYVRLVRQRVLDVLDHGVPPSQMAFVNMQTGVVSLNYEAFKHFGLDTSLIPEDAEVVGEPQTLWQRHGRLIAWGTFFLLIALGTFIIYFMARSLRHLRKARKMAEKANAMKTAFIQNMSYEVQTPLSAIVGYSQLLCAPDGYVSDDEKVEYLGCVMNHTQLLTTMMNDMLRISDAQKGSFPVSEAPVNLNEMARQAIKAVQFLYPDSVPIIRQPGLDEEARYVTDGMRVQQILIDFLTNACKQTRQGSIVFGSSLWEHPGKITFFVTDTGPGVPENMAETIFNRFARPDEYKQGIGLGLSFSKMIAQNLGGNIWLDTHYTDGARFVLVIPKKEV